MFLLTIQVKKILELLLEKTIKNLLISKSDKEKELSHSPKGIVKNRKSSINFRLPDTLPLTPQQDDEYWNDVGENWLSTPASTISGPPKPLFDYDRDFPPLNKTILSKN